MKIAIATCIREALSRKKELTLKGIGKLTLKNENGPIKFKPSSKFSKNDKYLLKTIRSKYSIKASKASKLLTAYQIKILNSLNKDGIASIDHLGAFTLVDDRINFSSFSSHTKSKKSSKALKKKKKTKQKIIAKSSSSGISVLDETVVDEQELAEVANLQTQLTEDGDFKSALKDHFYQETHTEIEKTDLNDESRLIENLSSNTATTENKPVYPSNASNNANYYPWIIGILSILGFASLIYLASKYYLSPSDSNEIKEVTEEIGMIDDNYNLSNEIDNVENTKIELSPELEKCIIITGSYNQRKNIELMRRQITRNGYTPYSEMYNGLTRIGIEIDCQPDNYESILRSVRDIISEDAWFLYPPNIEI